MRIKIPKFIGKKLYYRTKRCESDIWCKRTPERRRLFTKYYLVIGGRKEMKKRYDVYIDVPDNHVNIMYTSTCFKITAWLLTKKIKRIYRDDLITVIYDRKKGVITYEK